MAKIATRFLRIARNKREFNKIMYVLKTVKMAELVYPINTPKFIPLIMGSYYGTLCKKNQEQQYADSNKNSD